MLVAAAEDAADAGCGLESPVFVLTAVGAVEAGVMAVAAVEAGALAFEPAPAVAVLVLDEPAVTTRFVKPVAPPPITTLFAWAMGPPLGQDWPVGCWRRRLLISESIREPAPIGPGG